MGGPIRHACRRLSLPGVLAAVCATALAAAPTATGARACESANATPAKASERTLVRATLCVLNAQRERHGLRALKLDKRLGKAARRHASDMDRRNYFSHTSLGGASFLDRIRNAGYLRGAQSWSVGENIAWGSRGRSAPRVVTRMWMNSPGHRANILSPSFREIGIGVSFGAPVGRGGGPAATYATDFGRRG
jgi:uncharacterized protein YkwD